MAENLGAINSALSQVFQEPLHRQWNRTSVFLNELQAKGDVGDGKGKNVAFDTEFSGNTATTVAEGSDVTAGEYASDINMPAILPWAHYRSSFQISETEYDAARSSVGTPKALQDLFGERILGAGAKISRAIETDALTGTGVDGSGNPTLVGIYGGALVSSGAYAGINTATFSEWAATIIANGGTPRALTVDLLDQGDAQIFIAASEAWDLMMTSAGVQRKYGGFFTSATAPMTRFNDNPQDPKYGISPKIGMQGQMALYYKGSQVLRNAVNPSGKLALLNTNHIKIKYLPRVMTPQDAVFAQMMQLAGMSGSTPELGGYVQATAIPARIAILAKTGDSIKVSVKVTLQMCVTRPNSMALITDLLET